MSPVPHSGTAASNNKEKSPDETVQPPVPPVKQNQEEVLQNLVSFIIF